MEIGSCRVGQMKSSTPIGYNFYIFSLARNISTYPKNFHHVSRPSCKNSLEKGRWKCCPPCRIFSFMSSSGYGDLQPSETLFPRESSLDILLLFLVPGQSLILGQSGRACGGRPIIVKWSRLSISLTFGVVCLTSCCSSLHSSFDSRHIRHQLRSCS